MVVRLVAKGDAFALELLQPLAVDLDTGGSGSRGVVPKDIAHVPIKNELLVQNLEDMQDRQRIKGDAIDFEGYNPKKVILEQLRAKPEIDYEKCSKLLFKLITQVCDHYETRYGTNGMQNIIMMYKRDIGNKIYKQMMTSNERDVKNTLISIATYAKALKSEGANLYSFVEDVDAVGIIEAAIRSANITENSLRTYWGENLYTFVNTSNVFAPLIEALQKTHSGTMDVRSIVVCAANAFESFLADFAVRKGVSLSGRNGILQKRDALSAHISKKHRGMIEFVGQVRNAADHGADPDENNQVWTISNETARIYPCIIAALIKAIFSRDATGSIEV